MITAWRLCKEQHISSALTGEGARLFGGRWNSVGQPMVYLADSLALAALEVFVDLDQNGIHIRFVYFRSEIPSEASHKSLTEDDLPSDWNMLPQPGSTKEIGDAWSRSHESLVLKLPSTVVPHSFNYLVNPNHIDFAKIRWDGPYPFGFDPRMWK